MKDAPPQFAYHPISCYAAGKLPPMSLGTKSSRPLDAAPRAILDQGLGKVIFDALLEHKGPMPLSQLLTVLIRKGRMPCTFEGQIFEVEFVIGVGVEHYPEMIVYPTDGRLPWRVSLGGPGGIWAKTLYKSAMNRLVLSAQGESKIKRSGGLSFLPHLPKETTIEDLTNFLGRRVFDLFHESRVLEKRVLEG